MSSRRDGTVSVEFGRAAHFHWFARNAATPAVSIHAGGPCRRFEINAPGARASNTEVCWDEGSQRLLVGVWRGRRPDWRKPLKFPGPELSWFRSFYLPNHDGAAAQARVAGGVISIEVPITRSASAEQAQSEEHASNVIFLPLRGEAAKSDHDFSEGNAPNRQSPVAVACRRLATALCFALCLPVLLFSVFLFGFVLLPLLPFIAASFTWAMGRGEVPPPVRPNLPATTARPARPLESMEHAQAA